MKKGLKLSLFGLGLLSIFGLGCGFSKIAPKQVCAEEIIEPIKLSSIVIEKSEHGSIVSNIEDGNPGDVCVLEVKHDILYKIANVMANGVNLVEDEEIAGKYSFVLIEGENKVGASFIIDEELCGTLTNIVSEASEKDWRNLFTFENVITLTKWFLDGGVLLALVRYYIKDKKLENKVKNSIKENISTLIPEQTENSVIKAVEKIISPIFSQITADNIEMKKGMSVFAKCMALSQENTPESRRAILDELSGLKIADLNTIEATKKYIEGIVVEYNKKYEETMDALNKISEINKANIEQKNEEETAEKENTYDGTSI